MVLNQGQLSIVVSDWESYLGSLFPTCVLWVVVFCVVYAPYRTVSVFPLVYFVRVFCDQIKSRTLTTLRFGPILITTRVVTVLFIPIFSDISVSCLIYIFSYHFLQP
jgi:hypothetical protein